MSNIKLTTSTRLVERLCPRFTKELDIIAAYGFEGADYDINYMPVSYTHLPISLIMPFWR